MDDEILDDIFLKAKPKLATRKILLIWLGVIFLGLVLRKLVVPGNALVIIIGSGGIFSFVLYALVIRKIVLVHLFFMLAINLVWTSVFIWGAYLNNGYPYNKTGLLVYILTVLLWFVGYILYYNHQKSKRKKQDNSFKESAT